MGSWGICPLPVAVPAVPTIRDDGIARGALPKEEVSSFDMLSLPSCESSLPLPGACLLWPAGFERRSSLPFPRQPRCGSDACCRRAIFSGSPAVRSRGLAT